MTNNNNQTVLLEALKDAALGAAATPLWPAAGLLSRTPWPPSTPRFKQVEAEKHPLYLRLKERLAGIATKPGVGGGSKRTHMLFLLDKSTSMLRGRDITIAGYNDQVSNVRQGSEGAGMTTVSLLQFSEEVAVSYAFAPVHTLQPLSEATYRPQGTTALFDALGRAIELAMQAEGFDEPNTAFLIAPFTDGEENASQDFDSEVVSKCILLLEATGRFTFTFMGPKEGLQTMANVLAVSPGNISGYDASSLRGRTDAFATMSGATASYMALRSQGVMATRSLYADTESGQG